MMFSLSVIWHREPTTLPVFELLKDWLAHTLTLPESAHSKALQGRLLIAFGSLVRVKCISLSNEQGVQQQRTTTEGSESRACDLSEVFGKQPRSVGARLYYRS